MDCTDGSGLQFIKFDFVTGGSKNQKCYSVGILSILAFILCF